ncbi:acyltransferase [Synechococcus sp. ATX 2A4]|uniref:acyltransferase n=1 Tax=Synechococcus sp. ATX 2A4 TaxID=2823727 RepID=UPI0020CDFFB6|nr:acyltransferase [Synechococcus sp. ATX 2A4]MCP9884165.1 acyltransferase [Synechococcus sp. ATX 2A4]
MAFPIDRLKGFAKACQFAAYSWPVSEIPSYSIRQRYLRHILNYKIHPSASIHKGCFVSGFHLTIGAHSVINRNCRLDARGGIHIGMNVSISAETYLVSASHDPHSETFEGLNGPTQIQIDDYAWIGVRSLILPGIHIGHGSIVGAGSVVTHNVGPYQIVAGNPARPINTRLCEPHYQLNWKPWFDTDIS